MHVSALNVALQTINFVVLAWLLQRFLFKPVRAVLAKRRQAVEASLREAAAGREEADRVVAEYRAKEAQLERAAELVRQAALAAAEEEARRLRDDAARRSKEDADRARAELERERQEVLHALEMRAADLATTIAARLLADTGADVDAPFLWRVTAAVDVLDGSRRATLARQLVAGGAEVLSSRPLEGAVRERIEAWLASTAGKAVTVAYSVDPALLAGVELRLPSGVWRSSWRASLDRIRADMEGHATAA